MTPALRVDDVLPLPEGENPLPGKILKQAPQVEDGYIIVPDIPHTTLK
jgi:aspartyl-tRNA(Asn)/glutamyl-tRNA(Gln) amidotransferase subunit C